MPVVSAVRVSPTWTAPVMVGNPVAGVLREAAVSSRPFVVSSGPLAVSSRADAVSFVTACPLKEDAFLPRVSRMKSWPLGAV